MQFPIPIISVGNLSVGGTGKTPHIEYLIRLLKNEFYCATLSRGYGRKTKGYVLSNTGSTATEIGDEPLQLKKKFNRIKVAVDENRAKGVTKLLQEFPSLQTILLDDAFQHRAIKPGLSIVLTDFNKLFSRDHILPTGGLREFKSGIRRADIIIVTKCPVIILPIERKRVLHEMNVLPHQRVYFSYIKYGDILPVTGKVANPPSKEFYFERNYSIVLLTGIANAKQLEYYLKDKIKNSIPINYPDHHSFTRADMESVQKILHSIPFKNKIILTTEKDAMRLKNPELSEIIKQLPLFYIPIEVDFFNIDKQEFDETIRHYVRMNQKEKSIHLCYAKGGCK